MIMEVTSTLTHRTLMYRSKRELAYMVLERCDEVGRLFAENDLFRKAVINQKGDDLCWIKEQVVPIPPQAEFLESCRRFHKQLAGERSESAGCKTISQLEAEVASMRGVPERLRDTIAANFEDILWARARYDEGILWGDPTGLGAFSPHKHALACAAAIRSIPIPDIDS